MDLHGQALLDYLDIGQGEPKIPLFDYPNRVTPIQGRGLLERLHSTAKHAVIQIAPLFGE